MKTNVPQITFPFIYSLMLHTVFAAILLLLSPPLYKISSDFPFVDVRLYSSSFFGSSSKSLDKPAQKSAASNKTTTRHDISSKSSLENKESPENKQTPEKTEGNDTTQQLEQFTKEQRESEEPTASVIKDAVKEDRKNELPQDTDSAMLNTITEELKQKEEPPAEPNGDMKEEIEPKSEEPIKTARIQQDDAPMTEKAIDSLFDNEGIDNKEVKPFEKKTEEVYSQPYIYPQKTGAEVKVKAKAKAKEDGVARSGKHREKNPLKQKNLDSKTNKTSVMEKASALVEAEAAGHIGQAGDDSAANLPYSAMPSQSMAQEIEGSAIDKMFESQKKETFVDLTETKGIILVEPYGDLKLEIKIEEGLINNLKTTVTYREFLKKNRNKSLKKSEVKYIRVEPKIINKGDNVTTLIVETAGEGVYNFIIESDNKPFKASLAVKLYEKSAKEKSKTLGTITVNDKTVAAKILMPEGILWDDDSYFSGYMEDSESITKFNTDSGLVWKEYKE